MIFIWGMILIILTLLGWLGQVISAISPSLGARLTVCEPEEDVDPTFFVDQRAEAIWDSVTIWVPLVAGVLLLANNGLWAYFGLVGGSIYLYFAGRGLITRMAMQSRGIRVGKPETLRMNYVFLALWALMGIITIALAIAALVGA